MAFERRILRVLRTLGYPGVDAILPKTGSIPSSAVTSLQDRPDELARIVAWIEDRKVRGLPIADRAALRAPGPAWKGEFFAYLQEMGCPYDFKSPTQGEEGGESDSGSALLHGLSWLASKAVACEFEDRGKEYNAAARQLLAQQPPPSPAVQAAKRFVVAEPESAQPPPGEEAISRATEAGAASPPVGATEADAAFHVSGGSGGGRREEQEIVSAPMTDADSEAVVGYKGVAAAWSPEFLSALDAACRELGVEVPPRPSPLSTLPPPPSDATPGGEEKSVQVGGGKCGDDIRVLKALEGLLVEANARASSSAAAAVAEVDKDDAVKGGGEGGERVSDELEGFSAGVNTGDAACDRVATVLRMLFLLDLRGLQDEVNGILAQAQVNKS